MNPQYMSAGQPNLQHQFNQRNNNPPPNPLSYPSNLPPPPSLNNGPPNSNVPQFQNGPSFPPNSDINQKLQGLNINPTFTNGLSQLSSPQSFPPVSAPGQLPPNASNQGALPNQFPPISNQQRPPSLPSAMKPPQAQAPAAQLPPSQNLGGPLPQHQNQPPQGFPQASQHNLPLQNLGAPESNLGASPQAGLGAPLQNVGVPPQSLGGPLQNMGAPQQNLSGPPQTMGGPQNPVGPPQNVIGPAQNFGGPPSQSLGGPPQNLGGPPQSFGGPPQIYQQPPNQQNLGGPPRSSSSLPPQQGSARPPQQTALSQAHLGPHMPPPLSNPLQPPMPGQQSFSDQGGHIPGGMIPPMPGGTQQHISSQNFSQPGFPPQQRQGMPPGPQYGQPPLQQQGFQQGQPYPGQPGFGGMPPMPGQQPSYPQQGFQGQPSGYAPAGPGYPGTFNQQQQAPKRLDPDQMPSPIQVIADDQNNSEGIFNTAQRGRVPPLVTTDFIVDDQGNASPRFVRSSMYSIPVTPDMMKQTAIPFCLVLSPMADTIGQEIPPPLLDFGMLTGNPALGPIRCQRCKAYMCSAMKFIDAGRHFRCAFCKANTEVPMEYTQYINTMQQYGRATAEMALGTYEVVATKEYCRNNILPKPPALIFLIDVSYNSMKSGLVSLVCDNIKTILDNLPREESGSQPTRVGFITYSSTVQFYNIKGTLAQPQMLSVGDVNDVFVPLLEGFLCTAEESGAIIESLAEQIPRLFADNRETETVLLPAVLAGVEALKAADCSGRLLVFHTSLPSAQAPGRLTNREDRKLLATEKEKQVLSPAGTAYNELGQSCVSIGASVELFIMNNSYVDVATIGQLARLTGGGINKYTYFQADIDGPRVLSDICHVVGRRTAYDAVMRVRTSTGVRPTEFYGHFFMSNTTDIELASLDSDKAIAVEIKHDDKLTNEEAVYCQAALLYTHYSGQRRLRIITLALNVATQLADVYRSCEMDTIINYFAKQTVWKYRDWNGGPKGARDAFVARAAKILACYRKDCASPSSAGQLVLPESMKLMPLYINCMLRSDAISGGSDITCDDRSCAMHHVLMADVPTSVVLFYPRLLSLVGIQPSPAPRPVPIRCSVEKMLEDGVYLFENGVNILIWVGMRAPPEIVQALWGVPNMSEVESHVGEIPVLDNATNEAVQELIDEIRAKRRRCLRVTLVKQRDKLEVVLRHFLVEDRGVDGSPSYVDFLCHMHKEIRALL